MTDIVIGVVARGQGIAGRNFFGPHREHYEAILGPIFRGSINVRIDRVIPTWSPWEVGPAAFTERSRRVECRINGVDGFVLWVENPAPSYREGRPPGTVYPDLTMLEVVCRSEIAEVDYDAEVALEVDLTAL